MMNVQNQQMVQISGNLRVRLLSGPSEVNSATREVEVLQPEVLGFCGECHVIEFSSSIVEASALYATFTIKQGSNKEIPCSVEAA